jgi:hypothetical protein
MGFEEILTANRGKRKTKEEIEAELKTIHGRIREKSDLFLENVKGIDKSIFRSTNSVISCLDALKGKFIDHIRCAKIVEKYADSGLAYWVASGIQNSKDLANTSKETLLDFYDSDDVFELTETYNVDKRVPMFNIMARFVKFDGLDTGGLINTLKLYSSEKVAEIINSSDGKNFTNHIFFTLAEYKKDIILSTKIADFIKKYHKNEGIEEACKCMHLILEENRIKEDVEDEKINNVIEIFEKYAGTDCEKVIFPEINKKWDETNIFQKAVDVLEEFKDEELYNKSIRSPGGDYITKVVFNENYFTVYNQISDKDVKNKIDYTDLTTTVNAYKFVLSIHNNKSQNQISQLEDGFFKIMNEKIASKDSLDDKLNILKKWGKDVYKQMIKSSDQLRYVNGA